MYEDNSQSKNGLYSITTGQVTKYVYGSNAGIEAYKANNKDAVIKSVDYSEGEAAGNYWDSIDFPRN
jgi:hypothetical protein